MTDEPKGMKCPNCKHHNEKYGVICPKCGTYMPGPANRRKKRDDQ